MDLEGHRTIRPRSRVTIIDDEIDGFRVCCLGSRNSARLLSSGRGCRRTIAAAPKWSNPRGALHNVCERALKKAILHRKNALFYKTRNGAQVGDLFMSLIYTCQLNQANPFEYLTELQLHTDSLAACRERWMPWNYRDALV
jgi:hypothetical protein